MTAYVSFWIVKRIVAISHSLALAAAGVWQAMNQEITTSTHVMQKVTMVYYFTDLMYCRPGMLVHHLLTLAICTVTPEFPLFVASLQLLEMPMPAIAVTFAQRRGREASAALYFVTRLVIFPLAIYQHLDELMACHPILPFPYIMLFTISIWWFCEIVRRID